jgi:hypothetical protein
VQEFMHQPLAQYKVTSKKSIKPENSKSVYETTRIRLFGVPMAPWAILLVQKYVMLYESNIFFESSYMGLSNFLMLGSEPLSKIVKKLRFLELLPRLPEENGHPFNFFF